MFLLNSVCWEFANSSCNELTSCPGTLEIPELENGIDTGNIKKKNREIINKNRIVIAISLGR